MMHQLTGWCHDTGQEFWLVVFTSDDQVKRVQLRLRNTPIDDWSEPLELKAVPLVHPSVS
jgi:hypothetical protein